MNLSQNLASNVFSAWRSMTNLINMSKIHDWGSGKKLDLDKTRELIEGGGGGGSCFPYILLNEIQTSKADLCSRMADGHDSLGSDESLICVARHRVIPAWTWVFRAAIPSPEKRTVNMDKRPRILEKHCRKLPATTRKVVVAQWYT